jgi:predicted dehydrogenase
VKELKAAIIGTGAAARLHLLAYKERPECRVTAVCGSNPGRAEAFGGEFGVASYTSVERMLQRERPDVVSVATLEWDHEMPVLLSLGAGCHVLCEKVMAHTTAIGEGMVAAARSSGRTLGVNYNYRSAPSHRLIREEIVRGGFGVPSLFTAGMHAYLWAHLLDLLRFFFGDPVEVTAAIVDDQSKRPPTSSNTGRPWKYPAEMLYHPSIGVSASFRFRRPDFIATMSGSASVPLEDHFWSFALFGTGGALTVNGATRGNLGGTPGLGPVSERLRALAPFSYSDSFRHSVSDFVDAVLQGRPAPVSAEDGLAAMRLDAAVVEAARTGRSIPFCGPDSKG